MEQKFKTKKCRKNLENYTKKKNWHDNSKFKIWKIKSQNQKKAQKFKTKKGAKIQQQKKNSTNIYKKPQPKKKLAR